MSLLCCTNLIFISLYFSVVSSAENEVCGQVNTDQLRNSQKEAGIDEFPWMARIAYLHPETLEKSLRCHAILIDQQHLLTAGHCLVSSKIEPYAVLFGDWSSANNFTETDCDVVLGKCSTPILIDIEEIILYPNSNRKDLNNDIAIIRLKQKVAYSEFIQPICLPSNDIKRKKFESEQVILTGLLTSAKGPKQKKSIVIFNQQDCRRQYFKIENSANVTDSNLCGIACVDNEIYTSGSAIMDVKDPSASKESQSVYLIGLLSYGTRKCIAGYPDVFTRVDRYLDWIKENIQ